MKKKTLLSKKLFSEWFIIWLIKWMFLLATSMNPYRLILLASLGTCYVLILILNSIFFLSLFICISLTLITSFVYNFFNWTYSPYKTLEKLNKMFFETAKGLVDKTANLGQIENLENLVGVSFLGFIAYDLIKKERYRRLLMDSFMLNFVLCSIFLILTYGFIYYAIFKICPNAILGIKSFNDSIYLSLIIFTKIFNIHCISNHWFINIFFIVQIFSEMFLMVFVIMSFSILTLREFENYFNALLDDIEKFYDKNIVPKINQIK